LFAGCEVAYQFQRASLSQRWLCPIELSWFFFGHIIEDGGTSTACAGAAAEEQEAAEARFSKLRLLSSMIQLCGVLRNYFIVFTGN
jgi:hypothetical protein